MNASIRFEHRGMATLVEMLDDNATLCSDFSAPPGAPITGVLMSCGLAIQLKVRDCRRTPENPNRYVLRGRWVNLSRDARFALTGQPVNKQAF